ncbi:MAG: hypothetical protein ACK41Q_05965 [Candidatus Brocadia sp.]
MKIRTERAEETKIAFRDFARDCQDVGNESINSDVIPQWDGEVMDGDTLSEVGMESLIKKHFDIFSKNIFCSGKACLAITSFPIH